MTVGELEAELARYPDKNARVFLEGEKLEYPVPFSSRGTIATRTELCEVTGFRRACSGTWAGGCYGNHDTIQNERVNNPFVGIVLR